MSGQSIVDRLNAAKHTVAGSALGRAVVKATTEEVMAPKRKHLDYLLQCTSEINVSIPQMADLLIERTQNTSWVVTYKALITIHHLMCYGNERFSQYMASHSSKFTLNTFMDRTAMQGLDMSTYIRKYAFYLNEKRETYKLMGYDFCKVKRGKEDGMLRTMNTEKLLKTLPILQRQLDALVQFDIQANELTNGVVNGCFVLLSKDLIRLFACYNDGVINLLEKFFDMNKKNCKEALDIYKKFLERTDNVSAFLKVAESSGMDKSDIPDLTKAPSSLLEALESHVNGMEGKKPGPGGPAPAASNGASSSKPSSAVSSAINSLNSNSAVLSAEEKRRVLEEEAKTLEQFKNNHLKKQTSLSSPTGENPFGNGSNGHAKSNQDDLFGLELNGAGVSAAPSNNSASDDLLTLNGPNPFLQNLVNQSYAGQPVPGMSVNPMMGANPFGVAPGGYGMAPAPQMNMFQPAFPPMNQQPAASNQNKLDDLFSGLTFPSATTPTNAVSTTDDSSARFNASFTDDNAGMMGSETVDATGVTGGGAENPFQQQPPSSLALGGGGSGEGSNNSKQAAHNLTGFDFSEFDAFGDVLQPTSASSSVLNPTSSKPNSDKTPTDLKLLSTDLDSSLASLADNLDIKGKNFGKNHQWTAGAPQNQQKTGGQNWNAAGAKPGIGGQPMAAAWNPTLNSNQMANPAAWQANPFAPAPVAPNMMQQQQMRPTVQSTNPFGL